MSVTVFKKERFLNDILFGIYLMVLLTGLLGSCKDGKAVSENKTDSSITEAKATESAQIVFDTLRHDFGQIKEGEQVGWYFKFHNEGESNLVITNVHATCGCTVPDFDTKPVPPGGEGNIKVVFDSKGRSGKQLKTITVETNGMVPLIKLSLEADII